jgi:hypothetical protein
VLTTSVAPARSPALAGDDLAALEAIAGLAQRLGCPVQVVVARRPGVIEAARAIAALAGLSVAIDVLPMTLGVHFSLPGAA